MRANANLWFIRHWRLSLRGLYPLIAGESKANRKLCRGRANRLESIYKIGGKPEPPLVPKPRILCVDDEIVGTTLRADALEEHGCPVTLCHCPLAVLRSEFSKIDLAILDFQMSGLNGRELLLHMRALRGMFPIVLLTGCVDALSCDDRVLFARCIDKAQHIKFLLGSIAEFLGPNQIHVPKT